MPIKMPIKILELCPFSAGICGVWNRVKEESLRLAEKGYKVRVFSSNAVKGSDEIAPEQDNIQGLEITRFPFKKLGGESFMSWDFENEALRYSPDIIITHSYRHLHTTKALKIAKKLRKQGKKCKVFLVTHAPFDRSSTRSLFAKGVVWLYDYFVGRKTINEFTNILAITHWEIPYLLEIGAKKSKIKYLPNGTPEEFFKQKRAKETNKILFLGRISPIKDLETLISAMPLVEDRDIMLEIVGPSEEDYFKKLQSLISKLNLQKRVLFPGPIFDLKEKIKKIDSAKIFVLPSKSEGMPQVLIEAMSRGKMVIASDNKAAKDLILDGKNGYLFKIGDSKDLAQKINNVLKNKNLKLFKRALQFSRKYSWNYIIKKYETILNQK